MSENKPEKSNAIKAYERRWIKPTVITLLVIAIPMLFFGLRYGPTMVKAMSEHDAPFNAALQAAKRKDRKKYFENTPHIDTERIITTEDELPDEPVLVVFYLHHCPYCEVAFKPIEYNKELLDTKYGSIDDNFVYVEVNSPLGQKLRKEHDIQVASTILLLAEYEEDNMVIGSARNDSFGQPEKDSENILKIFKAFDNELGKQAEYRNQRERVN